MREILEGKTLCMNGSFGIGEIKKFFTDADTWIFILYNEMVVSVVMTEVDATIIDHSRVTIRIAKCTKK